MPAFLTHLSVLRRGYIMQYWGAVHHIAPTISSGRCRRCFLHCFTAPNPRPQRAPPRCASAIPCPTPAGSNPLCRHSPAGCAVPIQRASPALDWDGALFCAVSEYGAIDEYSFAACARNEYSLTAWFFRPIRGFLDSRAVGKFPTTTTPYENIRSSHIP